MKRGVIKVARRGFDIRYAQPKNLTIDSTKNQAKVFMTGSGSVTLNEENNYNESVAINHNLGYQPAILAWCKIEGVTNFQPLTFFYPEGESGRFYDRYVVGNIKRFTDNLATLLFYETSDFMAETPYVDHTILYTYKLFVDPEKEVWYE